jgi:hypothetical protein
MFSICDFKKLASQPMLNCHESHELIRLVLKIVDVLVKKEKLLQGQGSTICVDLAYLLFCLLTGTDFIKAPKTTQYIVMRCMYSLHKSAKLFAYDDAVDFLEVSTLIERFKFKRHPIAESVVIEMCALSQCKTSDAFRTVDKMFSKLCRVTQDPQLLARASQALICSGAKTAQLEELKRIIKILEESRNDHHHNMETSLALALNNFSIYSVMFESLVDDLKVNREAALSKLELKTELERLSYLNESLRHFTDVVHHIIRNPDDLEIILFMENIYKILSDMAHQYFLRGIKYKVLETSTLQWHLMKVGKKSTELILRIGIFLLDHYHTITDINGNFISSSKVKQLTVEEVLAEANKTLDKCIPTFNEHPAAIQFSVLSYLLSVKVHFQLQGRNADGLHRHEQFTKLFEKWSSDGSPPKEALTAKLCFSKAKIDLKGMNQNSDGHMSIACGILINIKKISEEFRYEFYQIYLLIMTEAINFSINRQSDLDHYNGPMISISQMAISRGYCIKVLENLSIAILRSLNMENTERAKVVMHNSLSYGINLLLIWFFRQNLKK